jgi:hypothetical protein
VNEAEERLVRATLGELARQIRALTTYVGGLNAVVKDAADGEGRALLEEIEKGLLSLEESALRVADAFPPELPGGGDGMRLH